MRLFDVETNQEIRSFRGHNSSVATIAFKPNSNVVFTGSKDSTIKCWDVTSGRCTKTFSSHLGEVRTMTSRRGLYTPASRGGSALRMHVFEMKMSDWTLLLCFPLSVLLRVGDFGRC